MLDTSRLIETPEGVHLQVSPAGPVVRAWAWFLDVVFRAIALVAIGSVFSYLGDFGFGLWLLFAFLLEWIYPVAFEVYFHGATPGKRMFGLRTVQDDGVPVGLPASTIRNLLRAVDFLPFAYGFGLISMLATHNFKRLGDLAAGTVVVYDATPGPPHDAPAATPVQPPRALTPDEQRALTAFSERSAGFGEERGVELAEILEPLTEAAGEVGVMRLQQYASWLHGRR